MVQGQKQALQSVYKISFIPKKEDYMREIIFDEYKHPLVDLPNISASRFQASLIREGISVDDLLADIESVESIQVLEDDELIAQYSGYTKLVAISIHEDMISVELENIDIQSQIDALSATIASMEATIKSLKKEEEDNGIS